MWTGDDATYDAKHQRVHKARGSAKKQMCEAECGQPAQEWATVHGTDGLDVMADYVALCISCHRWYDDGISKLTRVCEEGCTCRKHQHPGRQVKCQPGCTCGKHVSRKCQPGCTCGRHFG